MNMLSTRFNKVIIIMLRVLLFIILITSIIMCGATFIGFNLFGTIVITLVLIISILLEYKIINSNLKLSQKIFYIVLIALILRVLWLLNANNVPTSDFATMYYSAQELLNGNEKILKGINYGARFPHIIGEILYMAIMQYIFPYYNIIAMKIVNLILGLLGLLFIYLVASEIIKDEKYAMCALGIGSVFSPSITYTSVFCSENLAMPFYLLSVLIFIKNINKSRTKGYIFIVSSIVLGIGNIFRMIAIVILIAYVIYSIMYLKENILTKLKNIVCIIVPYFLVLLIISTSLQRMNLIENPLWRGAEPKITSILKGTNINSLGMWNSEDADIAEKYVGDYNKIESECKRIIYERLTTTSPIKLSLFYIAKLSSQWCIGDFAGAFWTQKDLEDNKMIFKIGSFGSLPFQLIYVAILILVIIGLRNKDNNGNLSINLFKLILLGYMGAYLMLENQCRYGYIICWVFVILGTDGINKCLELSKYSKGREYFNLIMKF
ncbi:dolichyl-phosphate-mannose--protein mannosyltransferase (plasmid) [Clostridium butyricum]|nr:dolichyl-phosphate-mannose--protein mannosyltransferase [Clostridium butyricum]